MAISLLFSGIITPTGTLSPRFENVTGFYIDATAIAEEIEIDVFLQAYLPTEAGEASRLISLGKIQEESILLNQIDSETLLNIPEEYLDTGLEMALLFLPSESIQLDIWVIQKDVSIQQILSEIDSISQQINNLMGIFSESINGANSVDIITSTVAVTTTPASLVPANANRKGLTIKNTGNRTAYIGFTNAVSSSNNFLVLNSNAVYEFHPNYIGEIFAVGIASTNLFVTQFI